MFTTQRSLCPWRTVVLMGVVTAGLLYVRGVHAADAPAVPSPNYIEIFAGNELPISDSSTIEAMRARLGAQRIALYNIDAFRVVEEELSRDLPRDAQSAEIVARERLAKAGSGLVTRVGQGFEGVIRAHRYRLRAYPAVVFDHGTAVVYGPSLSGALAHYRKWKTQSEAQR